MTTPGANIILDTENRSPPAFMLTFSGPSGGALVYKLFIGFRHTTVSQGLTDPGRRLPASEDVRL